MIDLHMHTNYSDGTDNVKKILSKANKKNIEVISITDHNTCKAYDEMKKYDISKIFNGDIIVGCEFTTSYDNRLIEILGYGFDYNKVNKFLKNYYTDEFVNTKTQILYDRLINKIKTMKIVFNSNNVRENNFESEFFERGIYEEIVKHPENKNIIKEDILSSFSDFFRKGLTNPDSDFFINYPEFNPSLKQIIDLVHDAGGIVFLAHPYQYKFNDTEKFITKLYKENNFDGIECFYTTFNEEQSQYLLSFAKKYNLLISGGSDYHGLNKKNHYLGIGKGNLNINKNIINNWQIEYYKKSIL